MNKIILSGRLTRDTVVRYGQITSDDQSSSAVARFTLAVDRRGKGTDFPSCVAFGKTAEFFEKYGKKGTKFLVEGSIQTGSYEKNGEKVYTQDVVVNHAEFCESKQQAHAEYEEIGQFVEVDGNPFDV